MPTYEYACTSCGEHVEVVQSFRDDPLTECPACGGPLRKVFGSIGVVFKGSGFYKNDSRPAAKESSSKDSKPTTSSESSGTSSESTGTSKEGAGTSKEKTSSSDGSSGSSADKGAPAKSSPSTGKSDGKSKKSGSSAAAS